MRIVVALALLVAVTAEAHAQSATSDDAMIEQTQRVIRREARKARTWRIFGGVSALVIGGALLPAGIIMHSRIEPGGLVDLSALEYGFAYTMIGTGALGLLAGGLALVGETPQEDLADELDRGTAAGGAAHGAAHARRLLSERAATAERRRGTLRIVGVSMLLAGTASILVVALGPTELDSAAGLTLGVGGAALVTVGSGIAIGGLLRTPIEEMDEELSRMQPRHALTAGVVPVRGGMMFGLGSTF